MTAPAPLAPTVRDIRRVLDGYRHRTLPLSGLLKQAAVAAIARDSPRGAELLFIRRAEDPRDPWSGHMAFPGGRVDPTDENALAAAVRETMEEVSLDLLRAARLVAPLSHVPAYARGKRVAMVIAPFVFALAEGTDPELRPNDEVQEALWVPLAFFQDPKNRGTTSHHLGPLPLDLPCYHYEGRMIWGLTLKMVDELVGRL